LKKINKSLPPNALTIYESQNSTNNWDNDFRNHNSGQDYKAIKQLLLQDQSGLCGYCEKKVSILQENKQRVEHFHSKSDVTNPIKNWALDWQNVFVVCLGGSGIDTDKSKHPLPFNLSCDSYKDHLIQKNKLPVANEGYVIDPLKVTANPCLFYFDKSTGALSANKDACLHFNYPQNKYPNTEALVEKTIEILNLNCQRLCDDRLEVLKSYNKEVTKARKMNDRQGLEKLATRWFNNKWPSYFTTRRILLGQHAEAYLVQIAYNG
jgi:uncharacterized protein (TIGR02646 family)